jgi:hypothetical protein
VQMTRAADGPGRTSGDCGAVNHAQIKPGDAYALLPWREGASNLQRVVAIRIDGDHLVYEGPAGDEWTAHLSRISGRWEPHVEAQHEADSAAAELLKADPHHKLFNRVDVVERGFPCAGRLQCSTCARTGRTDQ